jgi:hypothetical protein
VIDSISISDSIVQAVFGQKAIVQAPGPVTLQRVTVIGDLVAVRVETREAIEQIDVGVRIEQRLVLVLPVQVHEPGPELAERTCGDQRAVDEGPAPALRGHLAPHEQLAAVLGVEQRLHDRRLLPGSHQLGRGPPAEEEADCLDEDRLAGAGLARQHAQPGVEVDLHLFDDGEVLDGEVSEHARARDDGFTKIPEAQ